MSLENIKIEGATQGARRYTYKPYAKAAPKREPGKIPLSTESQESIKGTVEREVGTLFQYYTTLRRKG